MKKLLTILSLFDKIIISRCDRIVKSKFAFGGIFYESADLNTKLTDEQIGIWYTGKVGFILKFRGKYLLIDGYLSEI